MDVLVGTVPKMFMNRLNLVFSFLFRNLFYFDFSCFDGCVGVDAFLEDELALLDDINMGYRLSLAEYLPSKTVFDLLQRVDKILKGGPIMFFKQGNRTEKFLKLF